MATVVLADRWFEMLAWPASPRLPCGVMLPSRSGTTRCGDRVVGSLRGRLLLGRDRNRPLNGNAYAAWRTPPACQDSGPSSAAQPRAATRRDVAERDRNSPGLRLQTPVHWRV
jgi:hypothetical protein